MQTLTHSLTHCPLATFSAILFVRSSSLCCTIGLFADFGFRELEWVPVCVCSGCWCLFWVVCVLFFCLSWYSFYYSQFVSLCFAHSITFFLFLLPLPFPLPLWCLPIPLASISPLGTSARFFLSTSVLLLPSLMYQMCLVSIKDAEVPEPSLLYFALYCAPFPLFVCLFVWIAAVWRNQFCFHQ